jgi:hypothetical protein
MKYYFLLIHENIVITNFVLRKLLSYRIYQFSNDPILFLIRKLLF